MSHMSPGQKLKLATSLGYKAEQPKAEHDIGPNPTFSQNLKNLLSHSLNELEAASFTKPRPSDASMSEMLATDIGNVEAGAAGVLRHPIETVGNILKSGLGVRPLVETSLNALEKPFLEKQGKGPLYETNLVPKTPEEGAAMLGQGLATAGLGEAAAPAVRAGLKSIPKVGGRAAEIITKTGPKETAKLVKETKAANEAEAAKAADKTAKQEAERKVDLRKHFEKTQAAKEANVEAGAPAARKQALNRGVERLDVQFKDDLTSLRNRVNEQANAKYQALNEALDPEQANPDFLPTALDDAFEKIKGSDTEPTILKDMAKKTQHGDILTYRDLQGYYSEIGREITKGTLPGDVYHAYSTLQEAIGNEMQNIANSKGYGPQLQDARRTWREMKETFYDPKSPIAKALKSSERGKAIAALSGADQTGIEALAKYDPALAARANTIRGYQAEAKAIPSKPKALKSLPKLEPKPEPVTPEVRKIGAEDIQEAKMKGLEKRTGDIRRRGEWIASGAAGYRALSNILHGNLGAVPGDLLEGGIAIAGVEGIARLLENPKVVEFLTKPTAKDIAQIPPELRGDLRQVTQIAAQKGIKVDPRIYAAIGSSGQPRKRVAAALQPQ